MLSSFLAYFCFLVTFLLIRATDSSVAVSIGRVIHDGNSGIEGEGVELNEEIGEGEGLGLGVGVAVGIGTVGASGFGAFK